MDIETARNFLGSGEQDDHPFAQHMTSHISAQDLFKKLANRGIDVRPILGIIARAICEKHSGMDRPYRQRIEEAKSHTNLLWDLLREGPLFNTPAEQQLLDLILHRLTLLHDTRPPALGIQNTGKKPESRRLRNSIQTDLDVHNISLEPNEFVELCALADPDINIGTAIRERRAPDSDAASDLAKNNADMYEIMVMYARAIESDFIKE